MIQRIQSIYLILGAACIVSLAFFDTIWQGPPAETLVWYIPAVAIVGALSALVAVVAVFMYGNRQKQLKMVVALQVLTVLFMLVLYGGLFLTGEFQVLRESGSDIGRLLLLLLPVMAYILFYLSRRSIQRDIDLVKSIDRLR